MKRVEVKIRVPKEGNMESYINKPVLNRSSEDTFDVMKNINPKIIGMIIGAIELEDCYELTLNIWIDRIKFKKEFSCNKELLSMSVS